MKTGITLRTAMSLVALLQAVVVNSGTPKSQAGFAVLSVASGFATQPGTVNPMAGSPLVLFKESFESFLRRTGTFQGPPGSPVKTSPLAVWAYACKTQSPTCKQALYEMRPNSVSESKMDLNGNATLPAVPPGSYYLFTVANHNSQFLVWDLRVDLKPGANSIILDQRNTAPLDADQTQPKTSAGGSQSGGKTKPCQVTDAPRATKAGARANSVVSVIGSGYTYTYTRQNEYGRVLDSFTERGNFSNTTLYLLDEDAEDVLQMAGVEPGLLGSRFAMMIFIENTALLESGKLNEIAPGFGSILSTLGGEKGAAEMAELAKSAKADFECAMTAIRAHSVAQMTTDANARGAFSSVPAGTYYLYGSFYRTHKPVRTGGLVWNLKVEVKAGQNPIMLSVANAAWTQP